MIGQGVKVFRTSKGVSQVDLEVMINASSGSISRIESGATIPTIKTLYKIAKALSLSPTEKSYLLEAVTFDLDPEAIENARIYAESMMSNPNSYSYLIDNKSEIIAISAGYKRLISALGLSENDFLKKNLMEILFTENPPFRNHLTKKSFFTVARTLIAVRQQERGYLDLASYWLNLIVKLRQFQDFSNIWEYVSENRVDVMAEENRVIEFIISETTVQMLYRPVYIYHDSRFAIVEYTPRSITNEELNRLLDIAITRKN